MSMFFGSGGGGGACKIIVNGAGDWEVTPPGGQITQIGGGGTSWGLITNDDLFVSGKLEVNGTFYADGSSRLTGGCAVYGYLAMRHRAYQIEDNNDNGSLLRHSKYAEELTIAVGQGAAGINTAANLIDPNTAIIGVAVRVTQAPGGGATTFSLGRTGGNIDEFIQNLAVALGTTGTSAANGDGVNAGPVHNAAANTLTLTTDANVTGSDMKIRIVTFLRKINAPTS